MSEILESGYQTLRDFAVSSTATPPEWDYIAVYDDSDNEETRVSISGDSRCQWLDIDGDKILKVEFEVTGSDADIDHPVTLQSSAIWNDTQANNGTQITPKEGFAPVTFNQDGDNTVLTHTVNLPQ